MPKKQLVQHWTDEGELVYRIDRKTKRGEYYLVAADGQAEILNSPVYLYGVDKLPSGFYRKGFGLTTAGNLILQEIHKRYGKKVTLTVTGSGDAKLDARGASVSATIPEDRLARLGRTIRSIKYDRNEEMRAEIQQYLGTALPQFKDLKGAEAGYTSGRLAEILEFDNISRKLSTEDREALENFIPDYLSSITGTLRAKKKLRVIYETLDAGKKIYLEKVIREFRAKLQRKVQNEQSWQDFLSNYILLSQNSYSEVLEKESVSLAGKFPDFLLIDPYGYLDIYEIKKPTTTLMRLDTGRDNYFWDVEISKAISQVENYMYQAQRSADTLATDIRKSKGLEVSIVRPRGYIIAGQRAQLTTAKMKDDFRILCESLKNIDVILYDDLLESLEAFVMKTSAE